MGIADEYDGIAETYAERLGDELDGKPLDRALLQAYAEQIRSAGRGVVADVGCGPGHATAFLAGCGLDVMGVDVSGEMVAVARRREPRLRFAVGSVLDLDAADGTWAGAVALYSLIHLDDAELRRAFTELRRVVRAGGLVLVAVHTEHLEHPGAAVVHVGDLWGHPVALDFRFVPAAALAATAGAAGFEVAAVLEREPYPTVEAPTRRAYLLLRSS
jgi:SAM-dependent methyltransferase